MKKYLVGMAAIVIAIGLNAFTPIKKTNLTEGKVFASYYWYPVNVSGQTTGVSFDASTLRSKSYAMSNFAPQCLDVASKPYCILGSTNKSLAIGSTISSPPADAIIRKTN